MTKAIHGKNERHLGCIAKASMNKTYKDDERKSTIIWSMTECQEQRFPSNINKRIVMNQKPAASTMTVPV